MVLSVSRQHHPALAYVKVCESRPNYVAGGLATRCYSNHHTDNTTKHIPSRTVEAPIMTSKISRLKPKP